MSSFCGGDGGAVILPLAADVAASCAPEGSLLADNKVGGIAATGALGVAQGGSRLARMAAPGASGTWCQFGRIPSVRGTTVGSSRRRAQQKASLLNVRVPRTQPAGGLSDGQ